MAETAAGRTRRTRDQLLPEHTEQDTLEAISRIRDRRRAARDPDLELFPDPIVDHDDLDAVLIYLGNHRRVDVAVRRAEIPDWALLVQYQQQVATSRHEHRLLGVLDAAHEVKARPSLFGPALGLHSRSAVWNRRTDLAIKYRAQGERPATAREARRAEELTAWLTGHRPQLRAAADLLVDHRETWLRITADDPGRADLAVAIDVAGAGMTAHPSAAQAAAISYAVFLLRDIDLDRVQPVLRAGLLAARELREGFEAIRGE